MEFKIKITETLVEYVDILATDEAAAIDEVTRQYKNAAIILDSENYQDTFFSCENIYKYSVARYGQRASVEARSEREALNLARADSLKAPAKKRYDWKDSEYDGHNWNIVKI